MHTASITKLQQIADKQKAKTRQVLRAIPDIYTRHKNWNISQLVNLQIG